MEPNNGDAQVPTVPTAHVEAAADTNSPVSGPQRKSLPVNFVHEDLSAHGESHMDIHAAGCGSRAPPRTSKRITFLDDGKLFEGHLTVQSRTLKSLMHCLIDRQAEQSVVIEDLQQQMQTMRNRNAKKRRLGAFGYGAGSAGGAGVGAEGLEQRVTLLENFVRLWGIRPEDVEQLVKDYGDPVITPEPYTAYLLDLAAFRTARREARSLLTMTTGRPSISRASVVSANDTSARRAAAAAAAQQASGSSPERGRAGDGSPTNATAQRALEVATEALRRVTELSSHDGTTARKSTARPAESSQKSAAHDEPASAGALVDRQARQDIAELGDYVMNRFRELEARGSVMPPGNATSTSGSRKANSKGKSGTDSASSLVAPSSAGVDEVAREDAAASLEMISELEVYVEKRFKELSTAIANVALRKSTAPAPAAAPPPTASPAAQEKVPQKRAKNTRPDSPPSAPASPQTLVPSPPPPPPAPVQPTGPFEDAVAREETVVLHDRLDDLEGELNTRFQSFEERLRIVGRASMQPKMGGSQGGGGALSIDRKAREDASMSLMRVQQLERELTSLKRQLAHLASAGAADGGRPHGVTEEENTRGGEPAVTLAPPADLKDTYNTRVQDLEKEVAQRMTEVNRAISMLRSAPSSDPSQQSLLDLLAGQSLFSQAAAQSPLQVQSGGSASDTQHSVVNSLTSDPNTSSSPVLNRPVHAVEVPPSDLANADRYTLVLRSSSGGGDPFDDATTESLRALNVPRRVTVSRLRPPDAPLMGVPLVERDLDVDRLLAELAPPPLPSRRLSSPSAAARVPTEGTAATEPFGPDGHSPPQLGASSPRQKFTPGATHLPPLPPSPPPSSGHRSPLPTPSLAPHGASGGGSGSSSARRPTAVASLGHTKPCAVLNCAWCAAEKQSTRTAAA